MPQPFFDLTEKNAFITGAGQGIGAAIARRFAAAGAMVGVFDLDEGLAGKLAREIGGIPLVGSVTSEADIDRALNEFRQQAGSPDLVVNNAGIIGKVGPIGSLDRSDLENVLAVNLVGPFLISRAVLPAMRERRYGRIVNVASIAGKEGNPNLIPYSVSKAALIALTKALAKEVAGQGDITVNSISPAVIHTPMMDALPQTTQDYMVSRVPLGRPGTADEVAALVHYLASSEASFTTGQCYDISGGRATY
ncbi:MAG: SDR family oxidoreductase [Planctomycetales bacterium]|nr:SDR family oxidoreductase [Planctomycetales bacterium]